MMLEKSSPESETPPSGKNRRVRTSREGAAMIIVMMILLMSTASALFGIQSAVFEIRAAGFARQAMQTEHVSETALTSTMALMDYLGPAAIETTARNNAPPVMYQEPQLATGQTAYRFYLDDFEDYLSVTPLSQDSFGDHSAYTPAFVVDFADHYRITGANPGDRADGFGNFQYLMATYTARGRSQVAAGDVTSSVDSRQFNESSVDSRAFAISGPIAR